MASAASYSLVVVRESSRPRPSLARRRPRRVTRRRGTAYPYDDRSCSSKSSLVAGLPWIATGGHGRGPNRRGARELRNPTGFEAATPGLGGRYETALGTSMTVFVHVPRRLGAHDALESPLVDSTNDSTSRERSVGPGSSHQLGSLRAKHGSPVIVDRLRIVSGVGVRLTES
jgi:hypothetical protein